MDRIHNVDLKCKCILLVGKSTLRDVLSFLTQHHENYGNARNSEEGLWNVLNSKNKGYNKLKKNNYIPVQRTNDGIKYVLFKNLDNTALCAILRSEELGLYESQKCCDGCNHGCVLCSPNPCEKNVWCNHLPCSDQNCPSPEECPALIFKKCEFVIHKLRNVYNHAGDDIFKNLADNRKELPGFDHCDTWEKTWRIINTALTDCLKFLVKINFIDGEKYKDYKMDLRICLRKSKDDLYHLFGRNIEGLGKLPVAIQKLEEKVDRLEKYIKGNKYDVVVYEDDIFDYCDDEYSHKTFVIKNRIDKGVVLESEVKDTILSVQVQKEHEQWVDVCEEHYTSREVENGCLIIIQNLKSDTNYNVRMLTKPTGEAYCTVTTTAATILIKDVRTDEFIEIGGKMQFTCDVIDQTKQLHKVRLIHEGAIFAFDGIEMKNLVRVETKQSSEMKWINHNFFDSIDCDSKVELIVTHLHSRQNFDIRVLVERFDKNYELYLFEEFQSQDKAELDHLSYFPNTLLICHPLGLESDAHHTFDNLQRIPTQGSKRNKMKFKLGGDTVCPSVADLDRYVDINFPNENVVAFPPTYLLTKGTIEFKLVSLFQNLYKNEEGRSMFFAIASQIDMHKNLQAYGYSDDDIKSRFPNLPASTNMIAVYDSNLQSVFVITFPTGNETMNQMYQMNDAHVSSFLTLNQHVLGQGKVAVVGVVAATHLAKEQIPKCDLSEMCPWFVLTEDGIQSSDDFESWWNLMIKNIISKSNVYGIKESVDNRENTAFFRKFASRLFVAGSVVNDLLPPLYGKEHEKIQFLVLNKDQRLAISDPAQRKIIKGQYGTGKSIVLQHILQNLVRRPTPPIIYYIGFDEYTLHQVEMENVCRSIGEQWNGCNLICTNIRDLSIKSGVEQTTNLKGCLEYLCTCHPEGDFDVLIDEYDGEELTFDDATAISDLCSSHLPESTIIISVQSCEKKRRLENELDHGRNCFKDTGMKIFELNKTMRYTGAIHDIVSFSQDIIEELENVYEFSSSVLGDEATIEMPSPGVVNTTNPADGNDDPAVKSSIAPKMTLDVLMKRYGATGDDRLLKLITTFHYFKNCISGHGLRGSTPFLLKLSESLTFGDKAELLATYIREFCFQDYEEKAMVVCNNLTQIGLFRYVCKHGCNMDVLEYTDHVRGSYPKDIKQKRDVYKKWLESKKAVLIVDSRGSKGLEYEKVILVIDENEYYERHLFIESLTRCTSKLFMVTFQDSSYNQEHVEKASNLDVLTQLICENGYVKDVSDLCAERRILHTLDPLTVMDSNQSISSCENVDSNGPLHLKKQLSISLGAITRDVINEGSKDDTDYTNESFFDTTLDSNPSIEVGRLKSFRTRINSKRYTHEFVCPNYEDSGDRNELSPTLQILPYEHMYPSSAHAASSLIEDEVTEDPNYTTAFNSQSEPELVNEISNDDDSSTFYENVVAFCSKRDPPSYWYRHEHNINDNSSHGRWNPPSRSKREPPSYWYRTAREQEDPPNMSPAPNVSPKMGRKPPSYMNISRDFTQRENIAGLTYENINSQNPVDLDNILEEESTTTSNSGWGRLKNILGLH